MLQAWLTVEKKVPTLMDYTFSWLREKENNKIN